MRHEMAQSISFGDEKILGAALCKHTILNPPFI